MRINLRDNHLEIEADTPEECATLKDLIELLKNKNEVYVNAKYNISSIETDSIAISLTQIDSLQLTEREKELERQYLEEGLIPILARELAQLECKKFHTQIEAYSYKVMLEKRATVIRLKKEFPELYKRQMQSYQIER